MEYTIHPGTLFGEGTTFGHHVVIEEDVIIGCHVRIGHHVVIHAGSRLGDAIRIDDGSVIGKQPMKGKRSAVAQGGTYPGAVIGSEVTIGTGVIIYAGSSIGSGCLVADQASIREEVEIGDMTIVGKGVSIENKVRIGSRVKLELGCYITALSQIEDYVFVAPMVTTTNDNYLGRTEQRKQAFKGVTIKRGARIGGNATILPGRIIAEDAVIAAGSVVTRDVPPAQIWKGNPARYMRDVPPEQLLANQIEGF
ncbi:MAG: N-acetyltransferase [Candidatus Delongbacteria bacterium]|nr:N-acetyltransferase [Candidatus Delongbacteria bacterium]